MIDSSADQGVDGKKSRIDKTLVLGLGNTILTDDGIGIYVAREIGKRMQDSRVAVKEASTGGLELLDLMVGFERVILIDAVMTGRHEVGTLVKMRAEDLKGGSAMARHQVAFPEALKLGQKLKMDLPKDITIYGIEVKDIMTFGESCTPEVAVLIPKIRDEIIKEAFNRDGS